MAMPVYKILVRRQVAITNKKFRTKMNGKCIKSERISRVD